MANTLDLTRVLTNKQTLAIKRNNDPLISAVTSANTFLDEGILIDNAVHCCFFKSDKAFGDAADLKESVTLVDYRLGYMMLPRGMYYIDYGDLDSFSLPDEDNEWNEVYAAQKTNKDIFTPILFSFKNINSFKDGDKLQPFHICNDIRYSAAPNPCGETMSSGKAFHLFYYEGELFLPESKDKIDGKFFMIPVVFSEGIVVYYTIQKDETGANAHLNKLKTMVLLSKAAKLWGIKSNLQYNDHLTIVTCSEIEPTF